MPVNKRPDRPKVHPKTNPKKEKARKELGVRIMAGRKNPDPKHLHPRSLRAK